ncbi:MAG: MBL fold metallo-hydrolase [Cyclobacteriaceae bacterium]
MTIPRRKNKQPAEKATVSRAFILIALQLANRQTGFYGLVGTLPTDLTRWCYINMDIESIRNTRIGGSVQVAKDLWLFRLPKNRFRAGQSYALQVSEGMLLIDAVHEITKPAVEKVLQVHKPVALLLTHSDLISQAFTTPQGLAKWLDCPVYIHPHDTKDAKILSLTEGLPLMNRLGISVHHTPGHTPGSVMFYQRESKRLFAGDCAVGHNYDEAPNYFTHPPMQDNEWSLFVSAWSNFGEEVRELYPLHGKPATEIGDFHDIRQSLVTRDNVMEL